jgi:hypothetical protein
MIAPSHPTGSMSTLCIAKRFYSQGWKNVIRKSNGKPTTCGR